MGGGNKALLQIGGRSIVERVSDILREVFSHNIVVTNSPEDFEFLGFPMFGDLIPGRGSLGGLYTGLKLCERDYGFLVACDMPFLNGEAISYMAEQAEDYDVIIPKVSGLWEPLHAIYSRRCLPYMEELLAEEDLKIIHLFQRVNVLEIPEEEFKVFDPRLLFIMNVNTPDDLRKARALARD
jgi:molybdopterin-guanine dinucleotide biosynthesis protein A